MGKGKRIRQSRKGHNNPNRPVEQIEEQAKAHEEKARKHKEQAQKLRARAKERKDALKGKHSKKSEKDKAAV